MAQTLHEVNVRKSTLTADNLRKALLWCVEGCPHTLVLYFLLSRLSQHCYDLDDNLSQSAHSGKGGHWLSRTQCKTERKLVASGVLNPAGSGTKYTPPSGAWALSARTSVTHLRTMQETYTRNKTNSAKCKDTRTKQTRHGAVRPLRPVQLEASAGSLRNHTVLKPDRGPVGERRVTTNYTPKSKTDGY